MFTYQVLDLDPSRYHDHLHDVAFHFKDTASRDMFITYFNQCRMLNDFWKLNWLYHNPAVFLNISSGNTKYDAILTKDVESITDFVNYVTSNNLLDVETQDRECPKFSYLMIINDEKDHGTNPIVRLTIVEWNTFNKRYVVSNYKSDFILAEHTPFEKPIDVFEKAKDEEKNGNIEKAFELYNRAADGFQMEDRPVMKEKVFTSIAELYKTQGRTQEAIDSYYKVLEIAHSESSADRTKIIIADLLFQIGDYAKSSELYDQVAHAYTSNNLLKWSANPLFLKSSLIRFLHMKPCEVTEYINKCALLNDLFADTREYRFACNIAKVICEHRPSTDFQNICMEYDLISKLTPELTRILLAITKHYKMIFHMHIASFMN